MDDIEDTARFAAVESCPKTTDSQSKMSFRAKRPASPCRIELCSFWPPMRYSILFSHGNAEDIGLVMQYFRETSSLLQVNVFAYEYPGYHGALAWAENRRWPDESVLHSPLGFQRARGTIFSGHIYC